MKPNRRLTIPLVSAVLSALLFMLVLIPLTAQDNPPLLATNTPPGALPVFVTNTPQPSIPAAPDAPVERYALRSWDEASLLRVLLDQVRLLQPGQTERQTGIRLLQNELLRRFPAAPHDAALREELLRAMLAAPSGSVDMRFVVRPSIEAALNNLKPSLDRTLVWMEVSGFIVSINPANLDGTGGNDAILSVQTAKAGADGVAHPDGVYSDTLPVIIDERGNYRLLDSQQIIPAAPFREIQQAYGLYLGDINDDGLDEIGIGIVYQDDPNTELRIYNWRGGLLTNVIQPGQRVRFAEMIGQPADGRLNLREVRLESSAWGCLGERSVTWTWDSNFFRPSPAVDFAPQNRLACLLLQTEPLYEKPLGEAINTLEQMAPLATPDDAYPAQRAALTLAMLRVFNGEAAQALQQIEALHTAAQPGTWLAAQTEAFIQAARQPITPLQLCAALQNARPDGACDVNQVLSRLFREQPFRRDETIETQAARLGMTILDQAAVSALGRLDREAVLFDLADGQWWDFAPLEDDVFTAGQIAPPPGHEPPSVPTLLITVPQRAYDALLVNASPEETLNILDNTIRDNPGVRLDDSIYFLQALCYDLLGDRRAAKAAYFALWEREPATVWGQLAAAHLEER